MTDKKYNKNHFSIADIERYHKGQMAASEMHALEKAALDDPFLADALEGFALTKTPLQDSMELEARLEKRIAGNKKATTGILRTGDFKWLRVAAMVILLLGAGWLIHQLSGINKNELANNKEIITKPAIKKDSIQSTPVPVIVTNETGPKDFKPGKKNNPSPKKQHLKNPGKAADVALAKSLPPSPEVSLAPAIENKTLSQKEIIPGVNAMATQEKSARRQNAVNYFKGRIIDENNKAVPFASVIDQATKQTVLSDSNGMFSLAAPDTSINVLINSVGYESNIKKLNATAPNEITLSLSGNALNEVVITGYGKKDTSRSKNNSRITVEEAEPENGWAYYDDYIALNLKSPEQLNIKPYKGAVQLSFTVNENGEPENIKVQRSLCEKCDAEAIRILKEGPKWKSLKKGKRAKASIRF